MKKIIHSPNGTRYQRKKTTIGSSRQTKKRTGKKHHQDSQPRSNRGQG